MLLNKNKIINITKGSDIHKIIISRFSILKEIYQRIYKIDLILPQNYFFHFYIKMLFDDNFNFDMTNHLDCTGCEECTTDNIYIAESIGFLRRILKDGIINFKDNPMLTIPSHYHGSSQTNGMITVNIVEMLTLINSYLRLIYSENYK